MKRTTVFALFIMVCGFCFAQVQMPALFSDHMLLQQKSKAAIWGQDEPGQKVTVTGSWKQKASAKADDEGRWRVELKTTAAGGPYTLTVEGSTTIEIKDVLIGEVWLCSGQSNMHMPLTGGYPVQNGEEETRQADHPPIRLFTVKRTYDLVPRQDVTGQWQVCSPETAASFSAVGYFFGRSLHQKLDVPIGLIQSTWGGTPAQAWTSAQTLSAMKEFGPVVQKLQDPALLKQQAQEAYIAWHQEIDNLDTGIAEKWFDLRLDDSGWSEMELPGVWEKRGMEEMKDLDGIVWFRRKTMLPPSWSRIDQVLHLGPIDDMDTVWVNGVRVASTAGYDKHREYKLPASILRTGPNIVAVRVIDTGGDGGFTADDPNDMRIGPEGADIRTCATMALKWKYKVSCTDPLPDTSAWQDTLISQRTPTVLYNGMIAPLVPYRIAGVIWYQGEANVGNPQLYQKLFPAMIGDWRNQWDIGEFPFYYVQIAPFTYNRRANSAYLREAQFKTLEVPRTGMAVTLDIGTEHDIHPPNKQQVGRRLALWALAETYGVKDGIYSGPIYKKMKVEDGKIRLYFDYAGGGLTAAEGGLSDFTIAGEDRQFVPAQAVIDDDTVVVSSPDVLKPVAVRYGWSNWIKGTLFNEAGLPASSFRTDDWPMEKPQPKPEDKPEQEPRPDEK